MKHPVLRRLWPLVLCLSACGGGTPAGAPAVTPQASASGLDRIADAGPCDSIVAGGGRAEWIVDPDCSGCSVADAALAADGDLDTYATLSYAPGSRSGGAAIRVSAAPGRVFEPSHQPYVIIGEPSPEFDFDERWSTYLAGQLQDQVRNAYPVGTRASRNEWPVPRPTKPFDAYEYYHSLGETPQGAVLKVYELCNNLNGEGP